MTLRFIRIAAEIKIFTKGQGEKIYNIYTNRRTNCDILFGTKWLEVGFGEWQLFSKPRGLLQRT